MKNTLVGNEMELALALDLDAEMVTGLRFLAALRLQTVEEMMEDYFTYITAMKRRVPFDQWLVFETVSA